MNDFSRVEPQGFFVGTQVTYASQTQGVCPGSFNQSASRGGGTAAPRACAH